MSVCGGERDREREGERGEERGEEREGYLIMFLFIYAIVFPRVWRCGLYNLDFSPLRQILVLTSKNTSEDYYNPVETQKSL